MRRSEIVYRRSFEEEIDQVGPSQVDQEVNKILKRLQGQVCHYKGLAAEYRVRFHMVSAANRETGFGNIGRRDAPMAFG